MCRIWQKPLRLPSISPSAPSGLRQRRRACASWRSCGTANSRSPTSPTSWASRSRASRAISSFWSRPASSSGTAKGAWAFFRLTDRSAAAGLVRAPARRASTVTTALLADDRARLEAVRAQRAQAAQTLLRPPGAAIGTGSARSMRPRRRSRPRCSTPLGNRADPDPARSRHRHRPDARSFSRRASSRAVGLDASHAMLSVARANLEKAGLSRVELRQGDIYAPPFARDSFDLVVIHQVLHYLDDPARALARGGSPRWRRAGACWSSISRPTISSSCARRRPIAGSASPRTRWRPGSTRPASTARSAASSRRRGAAADQLTVSLWLGAGPRASVDRAGRCARTRQRGRLMSAASATARAAMATRPIQVSFEFFPPKTDEMEAHPVVVDRAAGAAAAATSSR